MQEKIQDDVLRHINESPNNFTLFLENISDNPVTIKVLARLIQKQQRDLQIKQKLASSINFIVDQQFKRNDKNPQLWAHYCQNIASNPSIDWKIAKIFQRSITTFMESFEDQFDMVMSQQYSKFASHHLIMSASSIINGCDFTPENRLGFIKKSFVGYIELGKQILKECQNLLEDRNSSEKQQILISKLLRDYALEYLLSIKQILYFLKINANPHTQWQKIMYQASIDENLFMVVEGFMNLGKNHNNFNYFTLDGSVMRKQAYNNLKAVALQSYIIMLDRYHRRCTVQQFDNFPVLRFLENQLPKIVEEMAVIQTPILQLDCNSILCMSILKFIRKGCEFVFMNNYFWDNYRFLYWKIVHPLIQISDQQIRQYNDDPQGFIRQAESLVEDFQQSQSIIKNCKMQAALLIQALTEYADGFMTYIVTQILSSLRDNLHQSTLLSQGCQKYHTSIKIQQCFTILSILTPKIKKSRKDLLSQLKQTFLHQQAELLCLTGIDKVRMLLYLVYAYEYVYPDYKDNKKIFYLAADCLTMKEIQIRSAIEFFKEYRDLEVAAVIWDRLIELIETTQHSQILALVAQITRIRVLDFPHDLLMTILHKTISRIKRDFDIQIRQSKIDNHNLQLANKSCMLECLKTLKYITLNSKERTKNLQIYKSIWQLFQLMSGFSIIQYDDEIIEIFNIILREEEFSQNYLQFLDDFKQYHLKEKSIGALYETYVLLIEKGEMYLKSEIGRESLTKIIINILVVIDLCRQSEISAALVLLQYIMAIFPGQINHLELFSRTYDAFQMIYKQKSLNFQNQDKYFSYRNRKNLAFFINLWLLGSVTDEKAYQKGERILQETQINVFKDFSGRILSFVIKSKVKAYIEKSQIEKSIIYLKLGIKLLDYHDQYDQRAPEKSQAMIKIFNKKDIFDEIRECFKICKQTASSKDFQFIMQEINRQIPLDKLKQLLSKTKVNFETRKILKIQTK